MRCSAPLAGAEVPAKVIENPLSTNARISTAIASGSCTRIRSATAMHSSTAADTIVPGSGLNGSSTTHAASFQSVSDMGLLNRSAYPLWAISGGADASTSTSATTATGGQDGTVAFSPSMTIAAMLLV